MRLDCIRRGLLLAGLCALFPLKEAGAGPAQESVPMPRDPKLVVGGGKESSKVGSKTVGKGGDGKSVVGPGSKGSKPFYPPVSKPDPAVSLSSVGVKGGKVSKAGVPSGPQVSADHASAPLSTQKISVEKAPSAPRSAVVKPVPPPRLEAFQARPQEREQSGGEDFDALKWTRFSTGRDDYFPVARVLGCNAPLVRQVTEMRFAMDVGFPRRPPKLPRIVLDLPPARPVSQAPSPEQRNVPGPDSEAAIEFFSEPATRTGVDIGIETVVLPIFRVAQPPPIPPVQSRANLRQE